MVRLKGPKQPLDIALRFLTYRPRSEAEVRRRLLRAYPEDVVEDTIVHLRSKELLNDVAFARFWRNNREQHRPRSKAVIKKELFLRGVNSDVVEDALIGFDDGSSALSAGRKLLRRLLGYDQRSFYRRMSGHLRRKGFGYSLTSGTVDILWQELFDLAYTDVERHDQEY